MASESAQRLLDFLHKNHDAMGPLLILSHDFPDPDSLASAFALKYMVEKTCNGTARICYGGVIGRMENRAMVNLLKIPAYKIKKTDLKRYARIALVDTQPAFENNVFPRNRKAFIVIDQHPSVSAPQADLAIVDTECGATAVILAEALMELSIEIPKNIATALAYGILSDTLNLYRVKRKQILDTYFNILSHADLKVLAEIQNPALSRELFATLARALQAAKSKRGLMVSHLGAVGNPDMISQVADFLLTYEKVSWTLCTGRFHGKLHLSLRTEKQKAQAGEVLRDIVPDRGKAGGHGSIGGGSFPVGKNATEETWQSVEQDVTQKLLKRLRVSSKVEFRYPFRSRPTPKKNRAPENRSAEDKTDAS